jgi:4,5-DOPA dioxygenase extradiol
MLPTLFISHGAPDLALDRGPAGRFLDALGERLPRPEAILVASAHFEAALATVGAAEAPETVHDFGGFDPALRGLRYPAPGDRARAEAIARRLDQAGIPAWLDFQRGLDHGIWVPLIRLFPTADIPVVPLAVDRSADAAAHLALGRALAPLAQDGVLVIGSGAMTHNLGELDWHRPDAPPPSWARDFADWMLARLEAGEVAAALEWLRQAPGARRNHPTPEHLLPLFIALGAAGEGARARLLHRSWDRGALAMDVLAFG